MSEYDRAREVIREAVNDPIVVSLGAYRGEDDDAFSQAGRRFFHLMVEPDPTNYEFICRKLYPSMSKSIIQTAIGENIGIVQFWRSLDSRDGATGSGSICRPTGHIKHFPTIEFDGRYSVGCMTLDYLAEKVDILHRIDLLWVDIQGAEAQMIRGGQTALAHTRYMMIEMESVEFYEGQVLKPDLLKMLPGWIVVEDFGFNVFLFNSEFGRGSNVFTER